LNEINLSIFNRFENMLAYYSLAVLIFSAVIMYVSGPSTSSSSAKAFSVLVTSPYASSDLKAALLQPSTNPSVPSSSPLGLASIHINAPMSTPIDQAPVDLS
jgi:hypothetical protein